MNNGFFNLYKWTIFNSASIFYSLENKIDDNEFVCEKPLSYYELQKNCWTCKNSVLNQEDKCIEFCSEGTKNPITGYCVDCREENCQASNLTRWEIEQKSDSEFHIKPTRKILTKNINYNKTFTLELEGRNSTDYFDYQFRNVQDDGTLILDMDYKKNIIKENLLLKFRQNFTNPIYDENRNLMYANIETFELERVCQLSSSQENSLKAVAITALAIYLALFIILMIFSTLLYKKMWDLGGLWKFFLHNLFKLQLIAMFLLLSVYMPCCIKKFLETLYTIAWKWDHSLGSWTDSINDSNDNYNEGLLAT